MRGVQIRRAARAAPRLLVSVANLEEALLVAAAGVDFIDLKDPRHGALGGLPVERIAGIVAALRDLPRVGAISATIGDLATGARDAILARVDAVSACGVDLVKVGIEASPAAPALLDALAASGHAIVPVFIADGGLDRALLLEAARLGFAALMIDTADKRAGSLFERVPPAALVELVHAVRRTGAAMGVAGALRSEDWPRIREVAPDFAGFRSAVCAGWRGGALDATLLRRLLSRARGEEFGEGVQRAAR